MLSLQEEFATIKWNEIGKPRMIVKKYWYLSCFCVSLVCAKTALSTKDSTAATCVYWQEQVLNDVATTDRHCMQAYLTQYTTKSRQHNQVGSQRFSLPIVGGFLAQRLMV